MEQKALLILARDFTAYHSASTLSKLLGISHVGTQKMLKRFKEKGITQSKNIGKSVIHRLKLDDDYNRKLISFLLADEANTHRRWIDEFRPLYRQSRIVMIYGSATKNYQEARDIDIMVITNTEDNKEIKTAINEIGELLPKRIHAISLTIDDFLQNIKSNNKATVDIMKSAIILYGQDEFVEAIEHVSGF